MKKSFWKCLLTISVGIVWNSSVKKADLYNKSVRWKYLKIHRINLNTTVFRVNIQTLVRVFCILSKRFVSLWKYLRSAGSIHLHESQRYSVWSILCLTRNGLAVPLLHTWLLKRCVIPRKMLNSWDCHYFAIRVRHAGVDNKIFSGSLLTKEYFIICSYRANALHEYFVLIHINFQ